MKNKTLPAILLLIIIASSIYAFNLQNPLFWDDDEWIKGNFFVHGFSYLKEIFTQNVLAGFGLNSNYYRPLLLLSFAFNYVIHGLAPFGYHLLSNSFHIANGVLVFILLNKFLNLRTSFIAALLFLIHPVQTEAVTYISGRGDPMSVFFMLSSLFLFFKTKAFGAVNTRQLTSYAIARKVSSVFFFILAILSRETAMLFPLLLMIFYISFLNKDKFIPALKKSFLVSLPFWVISVFYFILRLTVFNFENTLNFYSQPNLYSENLSYRLFTFGHALVEYFKIIFWPVGLHMERDLPVATSLFQWPIWLGALIILFIITVGFVLYRNENPKHEARNSKQIQNSKFQIPNVLNFDIRISDFRMWTFGWSWFFIALAPVSGIIPINAIIYEHWLYLPLIGFATLTGFYLDKFFNFLKSKKYSTFYFLLTTFLVVYFSFFAIQSIHRNILWGNPIKFYENILKYSPYSIRILTNLGTEYSEKGGLAKAAEYYIRAVEVQERDVVGSPYLIRNAAGFSQPYYNLGNIYRDSGEIDKAIEQYKKAIEVDPFFPFAYQNLAVVYVNNKQDLVAGAKVLEELKKIQPGNARVYYNLGLIYLAMDNFESALENLEIGLDIARGRDLEVEQAIIEILQRLNQ